MTLKNYIRKTLNKYDHEKGMWLLSWWYMFQRLQFKGPDFTRNCRMGFRCHRRNHGL